MELADILNEESVVFCSDVTTKRDVLVRLAEQAAKATGAPLDAVFESIDSREALGSTGLGNGIAIPHGKLPGLKGVTAVFARLDKPVEFDAVDDQPIDLVMVLLAPLGAGAEHLKALSRVARLLRGEACVDDLRRAEDPAQMYHVLTARAETNKAA